MIEKGLYNPQAQDMMANMSQDPDEAEVMQIIIDNPDAILIGDDENGLLVEFGEAHRVMPTLMPTLPSIWTRLS